MAAYATVLAVPGAVGPTVLVVLAMVMGVALFWASDRTLAWPWMPLAIGIPLHFLLLATGNLDSPLLPLVAAWLVWIGLRDRSAAAIGTAIAALVLPWGHAAGGRPLAGADLAGLVVILSLPAMAFLPRAGRAVFPRSDSAPHPPERAPNAELPPDEEVLSRAMEILRRATGADEACLWIADAEQVQLRRIASAGPPEQPPPAGRVSLDGHPFGWAIAEQVHVHLERGRRDLPTEWATEMLLVPVAAPRGLLALAYRGSVPPGSEVPSLGCGAHLAELLSLLALQANAQHEAERMRALLNAVRTLPGELQTDRFLDVLCATVQGTTGASGTAVAIQNPDGPGGEILRAAGTGRVERLAGLAFAEGESRLALALKHGVGLVYEDLNREREALPLCAAGERWDERPRSAMIIPLATGGRMVGAIVAWHREPFKFGPEEEEMLHLISSVAPLPLESARRYEELDRRASTDPLTRLPNRRAFEDRLAALAGHYDRYARPFGLLVIDVDFFKRFNDTWGHEAGDRVLRHIGELIRGAVREVDLPARLGGEEFVVLLPEASLHESTEVAERLRRTIEISPLAWNDRTLRVTASIGAASCPESCRAPGELLGAADAALYESKAGGRNRVTAASAPDRAPR